MRTNGTLQEQSQLSRGQVASLHNMKQEAIALNLTFGTDDPAFALG